MSVMLTAHALSPEDAMKSYKEGAAYYIPKEEMSNLEVYLKDILVAIENDKSPWGNWLEKFTSFFDRKFGPGWQEKDKGSWGDFQYPEW